MHESMIIIMVTIHPKLNPYQLQGHDEKQRIENINISLP